MQSAAASLHVNELVSSIKSGESCSCRRHLLLLLVARTPNSGAAELIRRRRRRRQPSRCCLFALQLVRWTQWRRLIARRPHAAAATAAAANLLLVCTQSAARDALSGEACNSIWPPREEGRLAFVSAPNLNCSLVSCGLPELICAKSERRNGQKCKSDSFKLAREGSAREESP